MELLLSLVKQTNWYEIINKQLKSAGKRNLNKMRFKVIWYRDMYSYSDVAPYGESGFL